MVLATGVAVAECFTRYRLTYSLDLDLNASSEKWSKFAIPDCFAPSAISLSLPNKSARLPKHGIKATVQVTFLLLPCIYTNSSRTRYLQVQGLCETHQFGSLLAKLSSCLLPCRELLSLLSVRHQFPPVPAPKLTGDIAKVYNHGFYI